jgi:hypothetical protein
VPKVLEFYRFYLKRRSKATHCISLMSAEIEMVCRATGKIEGAGVYPGGNPMTDVRGVILAQIADPAHFLLPTI